MTAGQSWEGEKLYVVEAGRLRLTRAGRAKLVRLVAAVVLIVVAMGGTVAVMKVKARAELDAARPAATEDWAKVKQRLAARMSDQSNLELGAVWSTKSRRICGLVNGRGSFGGFSGMVPFFTDGEAIRYALDKGSETTFQDGWAQCMGDTWLELEHGSYAVGVCATKTPFKSCGGFGDYDRRW